MASRSKKKSTGLWSCLFIFFLILGVGWNSIDASPKRDWKEATAKVKSVQSKGDLDYKVKYSYTDSEGANRNGSDVVPKIRYPLIKKGSKVPIVYDEGFLFYSSRVGTRKVYSEHRTPLETVKEYAVYVFLLPLILGMFGLAGDKKRGKR